MNLNPQQDLTSHPEDIKEIKNLRYRNERLMDFISWIFDNPDDEGIHWMSESEAWELFEKWEEKSLTQTTPSGSNTVTNTEDGNTN